VLQPDNPALLLLLLLLMMNRRMHASCDAAAARLEHALPRCESKAEPADNAAAGVQ